MSFQESIWRKFWVLADTYIMRIATLVSLSRSKGSKLICSLSVILVFLILEVSWLRYKDITTNKIAHFTNQSDLFPAGSQPNFTCIDWRAGNYKRVEDIFCISLPKFLPELKNPCFYDYLLNNRRHLRCLPYFYIIGMDKSGSTDLHSRLVLHPYVMGNKGSLGKETSYWSWARYGILNKTPISRKMTLDEYIDMFSETGQIIEDTNVTDVITGDATPMDLWDFRSWPLIPQNKGREEPIILTPHFIRYLHGDQMPKFIIQFREPIERLYSDYIFLKYGKNPMEFHNHSIQAIEMMNDCLGNFSRRVCYFSDKMYTKLPARIHLGCYSVFLREWFNVFPQNRFLITTMDEYQNNMMSTLNRVFNFLDLPLLSDDKMTEIVNQTRRHVTKNKDGVILPETVTALQGFYDNCSKEMADLLKDYRFLWRDHYS